MLFRSELEKEKARGLARYGYGFFSSKCRSDLRSHLSRYADDTELNEEQKARERWNDPAAAFLTVSKLSCAFELPPSFVPTQKRTLKGPRKPTYNGPTPPPNRFGIKPGYRWDGVGAFNITLL